MNQIFDKLTQKIQKEGKEALVSLLQIFPTAKLKIKFLNLYRRYLMKKFGYAEVKIVTAHKVDEQKLIEFAKQLTKQKPIFSFQIDPKIIGGFQIFINNKLYDASLINFIFQLWRK